MSNVLLIATIAGGTVCLANFCKFLIDKLGDFGLFISFCTIIGLLMFAESFLGV